MKSKLFRWSRVALLVFCLSLAASASTWRSTSGNIFTFYPDGSMTAYLNGGQYSGYWWWISTNWKFGYQVNGFGNTYVTMDGTGAIAEPADAKSWLMPQAAPLGKDAASK